MDDLKDVGGLEIFDFEADYTMIPSETREIQVIDNEYPGTISDVNFSRNHAKKFKMKISDSATLLYSFLIFFADRLARLKKFWLPDILNRFFSESITTDDENPDIDYFRITKLASLSVHGNERLFIKLKNGDRYSRKINAVEQEEEYTKFTVSTFSEAFEINDIALCGLLFLVRFDKDVQEISYQGRVPSTEAEFIELLGEYPPGDGD